MLHFTLQISFSVAFSPSATLFPQPGALISLSIIITHKDYNTVIKYTAKSHIYFLEQPSVYSHTVEIPDTNITDSNIY